MPRAGQYIHVRPRPDHVQGAQLRLLRHPHRLGSRHRRGAGAVGAGAGTRRHRRGTAPRLRRPRGRRRAGDPLRALPRCPRRRLSSDWRRARPPGERGVGAAAGQLGSGLAGVPGLRGCARPAGPALSVDHPVQRAPDGFAGSNQRLHGDFAAVITAEDVGAYKPAENHFRALDSALPELGVERGELLHVAQSLFHDHVPAKREGLPSVWINRRHDRPGWGATPAPAGSGRTAWSSPR